MKIFETSQIKQLDQYTIENEPISSIDLMERAAAALLKTFKKEFSIERKFLILAGPGNNGGDGLALGRMLLQEGYETEVILFHTNKLSVDCQQNKLLLQTQFPLFFSEQIDEFSLPIIEENRIIIDSLFGSGLTRPLESPYDKIVEWINQHNNLVVSIDMPSGLGGEECAIDNQLVVKADLTYTLQFPKLAMMFAENEQFVGRWSVVDIQLHPQAIEMATTPYHYLEKEDVKRLPKERRRFAHKGDFGKLLIWAGSVGMAGAATLAARAATRSGAGLVYINSEIENRSILQIAIPEAIFIDSITPLSRFSNYVFGPGIGVDKLAINRLKTHLNRLTSSIILDADALNILSKNSNLLYKLPKNSILTPHPKEFDRLFGNSINSKERLTKALKMSELYQIIIVLKGANTAIVLPTGNVYFNSTGNPGMAVGGMGDVLSGIIGGLQSQNYDAEQSALLGVYLHGLAADLALEKQSQESLIASDVIDFIGCAFKKIGE